MPKGKLDSMGSEPTKLTTNLDSEVEPMPDTVPSRRLGAEDAVRVRRPPYPTMQSPTATADPTVESVRHFPVDWRPSSTLPSGLRPVDVDSTTTDASEVAHATPLPVGRPGPYERYDPRRRARYSIRHRPKRTPRDEPLPMKDETPSPKGPPEIPPTRDPRILIAARSTIRGLPAMARHLLRRSATHVLLNDNESAEFGMAFVSRGTLCAHAGPVPLCAVSLHAGTLVRRLPLGGSATITRWAACGGPVLLVTWDEATVERVFSLSPHLAASLNAAAHRIVAQVQATTGPLGQAVCASMREDLFARSTLRMLEPDELLFKVGDQLPGLVIAGAGSLMQRDRDGCETLLASGDVVCPAAVLSQSAAPVTLWARGEGASVLIADRSTVLELACAMPSLIQLLASA